MKPEHQYGTFFGVMGVLAGTAATLLVCQEYYIEHTHRQPVVISISNATFSNAPIKINAPDDVAELSMYIGDCTMVWSNRLSGKPRRVVEVTPEPVVTNAYVEDIYMQSYASSTFTNFSQHPHLGTNRQQYIPIELKRIEVMKGEQK